MAIKRRKVDLSLEKQILTGMIISDRFLREVLPLYHPDLLEISFGPILARWCMGHYKRYEQAPGILIQDIFEAWQRSNPEPEQVKYIEQFLATLSEEYERGDKFNADYLIDKTLQHFKLRSLKVLSEDIDYHLEQNDLDSAEKTLTEYRKVEKVVSKGVDVLDDKEAWERAFADNSDVLFTVPGELGRMLNEQLTRDSLVGLMGIAKIGKTWNLTFLAQCAVRARCNVAMFQCGDLSEGQTMVRNGIYITQRSNKKKYCGEILIPELDCKLNQNDICTLRKRKCQCGVIDTDGNLMAFEDAPTKYQSCTECQGEHRGPFKGTVWYTKRRPVRPLTWQEAYNGAQEYKKRINAKRYKLATYPNRSVNVAGIEAQLDAWERLDGFIADVVIVDYPDILAPERKGNKENRDDSNETWMALRRLSQVKHSCVIVATQANGAAIKEKTVSREHYANDRRKYDHVTAMYSLSQTNDEKRRGVTRWGAIVLREDDWDTDYQVNVIGCLQIGRPYLDSF